MNYLWKEKSQKFDRNLPAKRWLSRAVVLEFIGGTWRDLRALEAEGKLVPEHPGGITHKRYRREQVLKLQS